MDLLDIAIAKQLAGGGGGSGTDNYNDLSNLPKINDTTLSGNKTSANLGLQSEINSDSKLASDLVDDTDQDNKFVTTTEKNTWNGKQNAIDSDHKLSSDLVDDANKTNKFVTSTEKNTWNAKQNAIDADHKLSSSLISFTDAEAAAIASGIDSSKVSQISTNQTNILYSLQTGVKNIIKPNTTNSWANMGFTAVRNSDGSITVSGTRTTSGSTWIEIGSCTASSGIYYLSGGTSAVQLCITDASGAKYNTDTDYTQLTTPIDAAMYIHIPNSTSSISGSVTIYPMICTKAAWDQEPNVYRPFAESNVDLTRLEAEDRAALAEEIDAGPKNKFNVLVATAVNGIISNGTFTQDIADTKTNLELKFIAYSNGAWVNLLAPRAAITITQNGIMSIAFICPPNITELRFGHNGSPNDSVEVINNISLKPGQTYVLQLNILNCVQASGAYSWKDVMICTKAEYDVSQNYAPFALPNSDLTQLEQQDRSALVEVVDSGAKQLMNLNDCPTTSQHNVTFTNIGENKYKIDGTPDATDTYIELMGGFNTVPLFLTNNIGKTIVFSSNSDNVKYGIIPIIGGVAQTGVLGSKSNPAYYTIPNNLSGAILRIYVDTIASFDDFVAELICYDSTIFNISPLFMPYISYSMVERYSALSSSSKTYTYTIDRSDFKTSGAGTYLIVIVTWSASPAFSLYAVTYSGGVTTYTTLTKIAGSDATISVTDGVISVTTSGRVQILSI